MYIITWGTLVKCYTFSVYKAIITIDINLYGSLAQSAGQKHLANLKLELPKKNTKSDLLERLNIDEEEIGYMFVNSVLCSVPGVAIQLDRSLENGDHLGIFSTTHMWPYQYRDGIPMTVNLKEAIREHGALHHSYRTTDSD